ncbi:MAG: hypothetical protein WCH61_04915, partial [bacterium]
MKTESRRWERLAWLALGFGMAAAVLVAILASWSGASVLWPPVAVALMAALSGTLAGLRLRLARREAEEADAVAEYRAAHSGTELFAEADEAFKLAARTNRLFAQYAQPILAALLGASLALCGVLLWQAWAPMAGGSAAAIMPGQALRVAVLAVSLFIVAV